MTQGLFVKVDGEWRRPKSGAEVKRLILGDKDLDPHPELIRVEATSIFGDEFDGLLPDAPLNKTMYFVGPSPYNRRVFFLITPVLDEYGQRVYRFNK